MMFRQSIKKGFTLVELLIVIAIIAILSAVVAPNAFKAIEKSKVATVEADFKAIKTAALSYYADTGQWPENNASTNEFVGPSSKNGWNGPYMEKWKINNPWNGNYSYRNEIIKNKTNGKEDNAIYITLDKVPVNSALKLKQDLDGSGTMENIDKGTGEGSVQFPGQVTDGNTAVFILISREK